MDGLAGWCICYILLPKRCGIGASRAANSNERRLETDGCSQQSLTTLDFPYTIQMLEGILPYGCIPFKYGFASNRKIMIKYTFSLCLSLFIIFNDCYVIMKH